MEGQLKARITEIGLSLNKLSQPGNIELNLVITDPGENSLGLYKRLYKLFEDGAEVSLTIKGI